MILSPVQLRMEPPKTRSAPVCAPEPGKTEMPPDEDTSRAVPGGEERQVSSLFRRRCARPADVQAAQGGFRGLYPAGGFLAALGDCHGSDERTPVRLHRADTFRDREPWSKEGPA